MRRIADIDQAQEWEYTIALKDTIKEDDFTALEEVNFYDGPGYKGHGATTVIVEAQREYKTLFADKHTYWTVYEHVSSLEEDYFKFIGEFRNKEIAHTIAKQFAQRRLQTT